MKLRDNVGQTLVFIALALFAILALAALGIDVGYMYSIRHELQRSADAGALAGASRFIEPGSQWSANPSDPVMVIADARARSFAALDPVATTPLDPVAEVDVAFPSQDRIRVTTRRTAPLFFARVLGRNSQLITATAVAEAAAADRSVQCLKPWGIPIPWNDYTPDDRFDPNGTPPETIIPIDTVPAGYKMILKVGEPINKQGQLDLPTLQQEAGHFFALSLCEDSGAADYRERIRNQCLDQCSVDNNTHVSLEPGNMVGPTKQAVDDLISQDADGEWNPGAAGDPDRVGEWVAGSDPKYGGWQNSPRLVKIPLYNPADLVNQGRTDILVAGFAAFWLEGYDTKQGTVTGYFVPSTVLGSSTSGPSPGPVLKVLRLVE